MGLLDMLKNKKTILYTSLIQHLYEYFYQGDLKMIKKKKRRKKHLVLAVIQKNDPTRLRIRTVLPEKGKGRKDRPRNKNYDDFFDCAV
ncbi:MAG: hypothetical protein ACFFG0_34630 [Candidatus Thorarchaeota archaeon]